MRHPWTLTLLLSLALLAPACPGDDDDDTTEEPLPPPGEFMAGTAMVEIDVPVGVPMIGYGTFDIDSTTPFAHRLGGSTGQYGMLTARAAAFSRGEHYEVVLVTTDLMTMGSQIRGGVLEELKARLGRDLDDSLVLAGNHTHYSTGRIIAFGGIFELGFDSFHPEIYERVIGAIADAVELSLLDLAPAEVGHVMVETHDAHQDRRCANDALPILQEDPTLPTLVMRREGRIDAVVMSYGYHGTTIDLEDLILCGDQGALVQMKVAEHFDHEVNVLFFNSFGADMQPGPDSTPQDAVGGPQLSGFDRLESVGEVVADAVLPRLDEIEYTTTPDIGAETRTIALNTEVIGYEDGEFDYPYGGLWCGETVGDPYGDGNCIDDTPLDELGFPINEMCLELPEEAAVPQVTVVTVGQIGDLYFVTGNAEWSTSAGNTVLDDIRDATGVEDMMFFGYCQDWHGYTLLEEDWWQGGYEAGGHLWGPKQGTYMIERMSEIFRAWHDPGYDLPFDEVAPGEPWYGYEYDPYQPEGALGVGEISEDVPATVAPTDTLTFTVQGTDPWLGNPVATLEQDTGSGFQPVLRNNGTPVDSKGYEFWTRLTPDPSYEDQMPAIRTFNWQFHFPVTHRNPTAVTDLSGSFRFKVVIPTDLEGGTDEVTSGSFTVDEAREASAAPDATAAITPSQLYNKKSGR
jgi:hypothetical protein